MGEEQVVKVELGFPEWLWSLGDKILFAKLSVQDKKDLSEEFYEMAKPLFRIWDNGEYPLYEHRLNLPVQNVREVGLFADNNSDDSQKVDENDSDVQDGINIEQGVTEPIIDNDE